MAVLIPCLKTLFAEFDTIAPNRSKASDGWIGDSAHQKESSDHNPDETGNVPIRDADNVDEVHAIDVTATLNAPFTMENVVQFLLAECRKNNPNGTDRGRLRYMIYNRRIWEAKNGWAQRDYTGSSPHTEHAHFSAEYDTSFESDTNPWGLIPKFGDDVSEQDVTNALNKFFKVGSQGPDRNNMPESRIGHDASCQGVPDTINGGTTHLYRLIGQIGTHLMETKALVTTLAGQDFVDEDAIVASLLAGIAASGAPEKFAAAIWAAFPPDLATEVAQLLLAKGGQAMVDAAAEMETESDKAH
jgi:hypothetical protein